MLIEQEILIHKIISIQDLMNNFVNVTNVYNSPDIASASNVEHLNL